MTAILPRGLISPATIEQNAFGESTTDLDNQQILRRFWRVYAIQSDASHDSASVRARNLFWRVWTCPRLARSISSATLMRLLRRTGQEFELDPIGHRIPLPPLPSHLAFHEAHQRAVESPVPSTATGTTQGPKSSLQDFRFPLAATSREQQRRRQSSTNTPAAVQQIDDTSGSTSNATSESSSRPSLTRSASNGRPRLPVLAAAGKSRTRPHLPRRKSSTPKSPGINNPPKSPKESPERAGSSQAPKETGSASLAKPPQGGVSSSLLMTPSTTTGAPFALPSASSWQSVDSTTENRRLATTAPQPVIGNLVDPSFRVKFVENQKKLSSVTNLAGLERVRKSVSSVRFADERPEDVGKGKEKEILPPLDDERGDRSHTKSTSKGSGQRQQEHSNRREDSDDDSDSDSDEADDDDDDKLQMKLPRTKSQLSLLIQHKREQTGSQDLGPSSLPEDASKPRAKEKSKEEELLSMGRRDGVTKAGGVQITRQPRVIASDQPEDLSSSSPEPLF